MYNEDLFKKFFEDKFTNDYITDSNSELRMGVSMIAHWCSLIKTTNSNVIRSELTENVVKKCCQMMRMAELRSILYKAINTDKTEVCALNLNEFLRMFAYNSEKVVSNRCKFIVEGSNKKAVIVNSNIRYLSFVLLMYVRNALANNADRIKLSYTSDKSSVDMHLAYRVNEDESECYEVDDMMLSNISEISDFLCSKIDAEISVNSNVTEIKLPVGDKSELSSKMSMFPEDPVFNIFNNMLSDFSEYKYY